MNALEHEQEWMRLRVSRSCLTPAAGYVGHDFECRSLDFDRMAITFESPKGGRSKAFTRPLPTALESTFRPLCDRAFSHDFPAQPSRGFQNFFKRVCIRHVCFHCLRVSYVTRLHRAAVPVSAAMRLINHSSEAVHRIYQRLNVEDVRPYADVSLFSSSGLPVANREEELPAGVYASRKMARAFDADLKAL